MDKELWKFTDNNGTFSSSSAHRINTLYFPLCNQSPIMSSLTPLLGGDLKTDFNSFLLQPVSRRDLHNIKSSRNFWIYLNPEKVWSATGVSKDSVFSKKDKFLLEAGLLWHKVTRENKQIGLKSEILSFIPSTDDPVEIMLINITNISSRVIKFIPTAAIPIFARSAHNLHDHSHVTSLLERVNLEKSGVVVMPTLIFDESGHRKNKTFYFVLAKDERYGNPQYIYPTQDEFIGEGGDLETPQAVMRNLRPRKEKNIQGKETMAGFKFKPCLLKPKESTSYIIILGIVKNKARITGIQKKLNSRKKVDIAFAKNKSYWQEISSQLLFNTGDLHFDNWLKWVNIQPQLRKIFGCSFLPDFDYGKGGRGWRDLWQDCLSLILKNPGEVAPSLINNFSGIRIDGSNATIIEDDSNEFIADRNNISRVWMDHGIWPLTTLKLYIHQTGNLNILLKQVPYFRDHQLYRAKLKDESWKPEYGKKLKKYITSTHVKLNKEIKKGKNILLEGAQGTMLDVDFGTYPFTTSSHTIAGGACIGLGIGPQHINDIIGVVKAYTTRVGEGPMPTELFDKNGEHLQQHGHEYGTTTSRPRRCGWLDLIVVKHSCTLSGVTKLAVTKLDVLNGLKTVKICTKYKIDGEEIDYFPADIEDVKKCKPVYKEFKGWKKIKPESETLEELPVEAKNYLKYIEKTLQIPISIVSIGPSRRETIEIV